MPDFLDIIDLPAAELRGILDASSRIKAARGTLPNGSRDPAPALDGHVAALIFEKPSTRTRLSFDIGIRQLGGQAVVLSSQDLHLGSGGESIGDTARVFSRYVDLIMIRTFAPATLHELARFASVPVINGLTNDSHPCQIMADIMTYEEHAGSIAGKQVAWLGSGSNVCATMMEAAGKFGFAMTVSGPDHAMPSPERIRTIRQTGAEIRLTPDPERAVRDADLVMTDVWQSMHETATRDVEAEFCPYQVNDDLMAAARKRPLFMHCLPAHRGMEVTSSVLDGPRSVVLDEAENRMHVQKAIMLWCLDRL